MEDGRNSVETRRKQEGVRNRECQELCAKVLGDRIGISDGRAARVCCGRGSDPPPGTRQEGFRRIQEIPLEDEQKHVGTP